MPGNGYLKLVGVRLLYPPPLRHKTESRFRSAENHRSANRETPLAAGLQRHARQRLPQACRCAATLPTATSTQDGIPIQIGRKSSLCEPGNAPSRRITAACQATATSSLSVCGYSTHRHFDTRRNPDSALIAEHAHPEYNSVQSLLHRREIRFTSINIDWNVFLT